MSQSQSSLAEALRRVRKALESTKRDLSSMPFFVRPMVKKGFVKRTGADVDQWLGRISEAITAAESGESVPNLTNELERLAENYRTAPDRAKRGMKGARLEEVTRNSREREQAVLSALELLDS